MHAWQEFHWVTRAITDPGHEQKIVDAYAAGGYAGALKVPAGPDDPDYYGSMVDAARCMIFAGNPEGALRCLERAYQRYEGWLIYALSDPAFAALRHDARFLQIMAQVQKSPGA